jgi:hypothetical protein
MNDTLVNNTHSLYSVLQLQSRRNLLGPIQINSDVLSPSNVSDSTVSFDYLMKIKTTAEGGGVGWKEVKASIIVCRNEVLSLNQTGPLVVKMYVNSTNQT